jgi:hypothetical protein
MKFLILFLFISQVLAAPASHSLLSLKVSYGEKVTRIDVTKEKNKYFAAISSPEGSRRRELTQKDVDYLFSKLGSEKVRQEGACPRQEIEALYTVKKKVSRLSACLGSGTELSKKLQGVADLLLTAI